MKPTHFEPLFCISSEEMPFNIRIEVRLKEAVSAEALQDAVHTAIRRYPYFSVRVRREGEDYVSEYNPAPIPVCCGDTVPPLGSEALDGHMLALACHGREIDFFTSHVITDGAGFMPFVKSVLYYYLCRKTGTELDPTGIELADAPFYADELGDPVPAEAETAEPLYIKKCGDFFRLYGDGLADSGEGRVFRFRVREEELLAFSYDHDGSPSALLSVLMAKAIYALHPELTKSLVSAVSFNLRPGLGNRKSYRMLCSTVLLEYPRRVMDQSVLQLCTCSRGMTTLQSQPENVLYLARERKKLVESLRALPTLEEKKRICGALALRDATENSFSVSYVGKPDYGSLAPYLDAVYNITDGSTYRTAFIETASANGSFNIAFIQGFSTDVYYREFLRQIRACGLEVKEEDVTPLRTPKTCLPD